MVTVIQLMTAYSFFMPLERAPTGMVMSVEKVLIWNLYMTADPTEEFSLEEGVEYQFTVVASNSFGNSSHSNTVFFTPLPASTPSGVVNSTDINSSNLQPLLYAGIGIGVLLVIVAVAMVSTYILYKSEL